MPRNLPHWTNCAPPGQAEEAPIAEIAGFSILGLVAGGSIPLIVAAIVGQAATVGCVAGAAVIWMAVAGLADFISWYDNRRLMCIKDDQCAIGTVVTKPSVATDGDVGLNIALAPYAPNVQYEALQNKTGATDVVAHLQAMPSRDDVVHLLQDVVHNDLLTQAGKDYQKRYMVTTSAVDDVHPNASANIPDDSFQAGGPTNPMFRGPVTDDPSGDPSSISRPWVYMHTEIEGHNLIAWLENLRDALIAGGLAWIAACAICVAVSGAEWLCGWIGAVIAALLALLVWLIKQFGTNEPYDASIPEVTVPDDFATPSTSGHDGDVVVVFGRWIMDMEHHKYFELHPVKAWYRICSMDTRPIPILDDDVPDGCAFDPSDLTAEEAERICALVTDAETTDPIESVSTGLTHALAMFAGVKNDVPDIR